MAKGFLVYIKGRRSRGILSLGLEFKSMSEEILRGILQATSAAINPPKEKPIKWILFWGSFLIKLAACWASWFKVNSCLGEETVGKSMARQLYLCFIKVNSDWNTLELSA